MAEGILQRTLKNLLPENIPSVAKATLFAGFTDGLKPVPFKAAAFSAPSEVLRYLEAKSEIRGSLHCATAPVGMTDLVGYNVT